MAKKSKVNYLDYIPLYNEAYPWKLDHDEKVVIQITWNGFFHWLAQKAFRKPKTSYIHLDDFGSFVWQQIDGTRSVYDIAKLVKEEFGDKAEPLYERLTRFFMTLKEQKYIVWKAG